MIAVLLTDLALDHCGDKVRSANIGIIAYGPLCLMWIWAAVTPEQVKEVFVHCSPTKVERF